MWTKPGNSYKQKTFLGQPQFSLSELEASALSAGCTQAEKTNGKKVVNSPSTSHNGIIPLLSSFLSKPVQFFIVLGLVFTLSACGGGVSDNEETAPDAPQNVQAVTGDGQVTVSWDDVTSATSYNVYWNNTGGVTTADNQVADVTSSYDHTGLLNGTTYYYVVTAVNNAGESDPSNEVPATPQVPNQDNAFMHLYKIMDKYHNTFDVYTNQDDAGNHYYPSGWMGQLSAITMDSDWTSGCYAGTSCIKVGYTTGGVNWAGVYWQNPENNWGDVANGGYDLTGATELSFWAKGENGGERIEFFAGGIASTYGDSLPKVSTDDIFLTNDWQEYVIDLTSQDLSHVVGGFGWVTNSSNNPSGAVFYLDDIRYNKSRLNDPRFLVSYETLPVIDPDRYIRNVGFMYDNALALLTFLAGGTTKDLNSAKLIADAFVIAQNNDRYYTDGRLRNAYMGGDLTDYMTGKVRIPGWTNPSDQTWNEDEFQVSTHTGNLAWVIIALVAYYENVGDTSYLNAAAVLGDWIENETRDTRGSGGYTGGYLGWEPSPAKILWKSTEHNIDIYVAFTRLYNTTADTKWDTGAQYAKTFVEAMWNTTDGHFWTGTLDDGVTINYINIPLDVQSWAFLAFGSYVSALQWAENNCYLTSDGFEGFDFNTDKDGIWFEGTAQMIVAYQADNQLSKSDHYLAELRKARVSATNADGFGIVEASHDGLTTGFDWEYFSRLHVGATAWFLLAELGINPYW